jgi:hypothetical protein
MTRHRALSYAVCLFGIGTSVVFMLSAVLPLPVLQYFPLSRRFSFVKNPGELSMDFYGRSLLALASGGALALFVYAVLRLLAGGTPEPAATENADGSQEAGDEAVVEAGEPGRRSTLLLFTAYLATAVLLAIALYAYQLIGRLPTPEPLPPGYVPR